MQGSGLLLGLVPLVTAGFLFIVSCYATRLRAATAEGQKLFFMCAATGLAIGAIAFPLFRLLAPESVVTWLHGNYPLPPHELGALVFALVLGPLLAGFVNGALWLRARTAADNPTGLPTWNYLFVRWAKNAGSPLQQLLIEAIDGEKLVLFNLTSRKVYCGYVMRLPPIFRTDDQYIEVIPVFSTERDKDSLKLLERLTYPAVLYWRARNWRDQLRAIVGDTESARVGMPSEQRVALKQLLDDAEAKLIEFESQDKDGYFKDLRIEDWAKVIPIKQIESASVFDEDAHRQWFSAIAAGDAPAKPSVPTTEPASVSQLASQG
jgi:hypothetical protein